MSGDQALEIHVLNALAFVKTTKEVEVATAAVRTTRRTLSDSRSDSLSDGQADGPGVSFDSSPPAGGRSSCQPSSNNGAASSVAYHGMVPSARPCRRANLQMPHPVPLRVPGFAWPDAGHEWVPRAAIERFTTQRQP